MVDERNRLVAGRLQAGNHAVRLFLDGLRRRLILALRQGRVQIGQRLLLPRVDALDFGVVVVHNLLLQVVNDLGRVGQSVGQRRLDGLVHAVQLDLLRVNRRFRRDVNLRLQLLDARPVVVAEQLIEQLFGRPAQHAELLQ